MRKSATKKREGSWQSLIFYGEAFGFVVAWVAGLVLLVQAANSGDEVPKSPNIDTFAGTSLGGEPTNPLK